MKVPVEICAEGLASALAAGEGGAARVELCEGLERTVAWFRTLPAFADLA